jgi:hypothetical protein
MAILNEQFSRMQKLAGVALTENKMEETKPSIRERIKQHITDILTEADKEEEETTDTETTDTETTDTETTETTPEDTGVVAGVDVEKQKALSAKLLELRKVAEEFGDPKITTMVGNILTYFTRTTVNKQNQQ